MHFKIQSLFILPALVPFACAESDCTRTATCPVDAGPAGKADAAAATSTEGADGNPALPPSSTRAELDGGVRSPVDEPASEPTPAPVPLDARDAGAVAAEVDSDEQASVEDVSGDASPALPDGAETAATEETTDADEGPVISVPDRELDANTEDEANNVDDADTSCALGDTRPCLDALGACAQGVETCDADGTFGSCSVQPELVDSCLEAGDDANCDGVVNGGCECTSGQERPCGPSAQVGICVQGTSLCDDGVWGLCVGAVLPALRQCGSPDDNDCDGAADNALDGACQCAQGATEPCSAHPGFDGTGPCMAGLRQCVVSADSTSSRWGECVGAVGPLSGDLCELGDDSNCNGVPNQGCDFTPPAVASSLPEDGDTGVVADTVLTIVFSEPMDRASTESAVQLSSAPPLAFTWNDAGTVLTVTPGTPFDYARGQFSDLDSLEATQYSLTVGTEATDAAGNALLAPLEVQFSTLRRVDQRLPLAEPDGAYLIVRFSDISASPWPCQEGVSWVGYQPNYSLTVTTFDLSELPMGVAEFEQAKLVAEQVAVDGDPFADHGPIEVEHITMSTGPDSGDAAYVDTLHAVGTLSSGPNIGPRSLDVTLALEEDYELRMERDQQSEYRILTDFGEPFPTSPNHASFACSAFAIEATYLLP
jgi:hypothetical protein